MNYTESREDRLHRGMQQSGNTAVLIQATENSQPVELLWLWIEAEQWHRVVGLLKDLDSFGDLWHRDSGAVKEAWDVIEANSTHRMVETYREHWQEPVVMRGSFELGEMLMETGNHSESALIFDIVLLHHKQSGYVQELVQALDCRARLYWLTGEFDDALALLKEEERLCREHGDIAGRAQALNNQALILEEQDVKRAATLYSRSAEMNREIGEMEGLASTVCNQARLLADSGETEMALGLLDSVEETAASLMLRATVLVGQGRDAKDFAKRGFEMADRAYDKPLMGEFWKLLAGTV